MREKWLLRIGDGDSFANVKFDQFLLTAAVGERVVTIEQEPHTPTSGHGREGQLWLLQKQPEMTLTVGGQR